MKLKIVIVGIGGRTGSMFARELQGVCDVVGVGLEREVEAINNGKIKIQRSIGIAEPLIVKAILARDFGAEMEKNYPDFIWLAVKNPVASAVKFYYSQFAGKGKFPALILSQNGLSAIGDAQTALKEALGQDADKVRIIRVCLSNGIDLKNDEAAYASAGATASQSGTSAISYKIPIKLGFGAVNGSSADLKEILRANGIKNQEYQSKDVRKMENSKLFTNLIGMVSATRGLAVSVGLRDKKVFKEEVAMLKEFVVAVKKSGSGFVNDFAGYPIKMLAEMIMLPAPLLVPFRGIFERIVSKGRNRPKDLSEIDYYNGEVAKLGQKTGVPTPVNEEIIRRAKANPAIVRGNAE
jgi:ketopantoate reductase